MELRCPGNKKYADIDSNGYIEIKCQSRFCGAEIGEVLLHCFSPFTGELITTKRFKDPQSSIKKESST